ncbi:MAG: helix-turn-helix domain-containing protein [Isosphaeraceae bacterium]
MNGLARSWDVQLKERLQALRSCRQTQGETPTMIAQGGLCAKSQVHRVAERFITEGLAGLADRREDNDRHRGVLGAEASAGYTSIIRAGSTA